MFSNKLFALIVLWAICFLASPASALCGAGSSQCFVVAAGGNSGTAATWSATSGGATCSGTTCPTGPSSTDSVCLDSAAGTLTINAALTIASFDQSGTCTGGSGTAYAHTSTVSGDQTITISGTVFKLVASGLTAVTTTQPQVNFTSSSTTALTSAGNAFGGLTVNGTGGVQLQDALSCVQYSTTLNSTLQLTAGTFDGNGKAVTNCFLSIAGAGTKTFSPGTATWTWNGNNSGIGAVSIGGSSNTLNTTNWSIDFKDTATGTGTDNLNFPNSGFSLAGITLRTGGAGRAYAINGNITITATLAFTGTGIYLCLPAGYTLTANGATITLNGTSGNFNFINTDADQGAGTLSVSSGTVTCNWCILRGFKGSGGATFNAANSIDQGQNTGWTITAPSFGGSAFIIGG